MRFLKPFEQSGSMYIADPFAGDSIDLQSLSRLSDPISSMTKLADGRYQIEFYPLHSLFLAVGEFVWTGYGRHLVMLAACVISLLTWRRLAAALSMRRSTIEIFSWLYAISPGLIFVGKFPVSEATAGLFIPMVLLSILRYLRTQSLLNLHLVPIVVWSGLLSFTRLSILSLLPGILLFAIFALLETCKGDKKHTEVVRACLAILALSTGLFVAGAVYAKKQAGLYLPMRDYLRSVVEFGRISWSTGFGLSLVLILVVGVAWRYSKKVRLELVFEVLVVLGLVAIAIKQMLDLTRGVPLAPWGYEYRNDGILNIRFHFLYFLGLLVGPLLVVLIPLSKTFRGVFLLPRILRLVLFGIIAASLARPNVPYLYYYGRYFLIDLLPLILLAISAVLTQLYYSSARGEKVSVFVLGSATFYFVLFSALPMLRSEQENPEFYDQVSIEVGGDLVLVDGMHQQIVPTLIVSEELRTISVTPSSEQEFFNIVKSLGDGAVGFDGLWVMTRGRDGREFLFEDSFLSNTAHFKEDGLRYSDTPYSVLLPTRYVTTETGWLLSRPPRCEDVPEVAASGRLRGFAHNLVKLETGFGGLEGGRASVICSVGDGENVLEMLSTDDFRGLGDFEELRCVACEGSRRWLVLSTP